MVSRKFRQLLLLTFICVGFLFGNMSAALADTYGGGSYNACQYGQGCATSSPNSSSNSTTTNPGGPMVTSGSILLNDFGDYFTATGKSINLTSGQVVYFDVTAGGKTIKYSATVKQVGDNFVVITLAPPAHDIRLNVGETQQYDVNGDGKADIQITLISSSNGIVSLILRNVSTTTPVPKPSAEPTKTHSSLPILIFSVFALLAAFFLFIFARRKRDTDSKSSIH